MQEPANKYCKRKDPTWHSDFMHIIRHRIHFLQGLHPSVSVPKAEEEHQWGVLESDWVQMWSQGPQRATRWSLVEPTDVCLTFVSPVTQTQNWKHQSASNYQVPNAGVGRCSGGNFKTSQPTQLGCINIVTLRLYSSFPFDVLSFSKNLFKFSNESIKVTRVACHQKVTGKETCGGHSCNEWHRDVCARAECASFFSN